MSRADASWRQFFWARFSRLYPLHLITLVTVAILQLANLRILGSYKIYEVNDLKHFVLNVFFVQSWGFADGYSFNAPTWSVSVEIAVYILFFILLKTFKNTGLRGALALLVLWTYATKFFSHLFFAECLSYFLTGVVIWFATQAKKSLNSPVIGLASSFFAAFLVGRGDLSSPSTILIFILCLTAILDTFRTPFRQKAVVRFGKLTYSAFLWHIPLQLVTILVLESASATTEVYKSEAFWFFYLVAVYLIANFSFVFIENPIKLLMIRCSLSRQN